MLFKKLILCAGTGMLLCSFPAFSEAAGRRNAAAEENREPTGEVVDGVREIRMEASQFEFDPETIVVYEGETVEIAAVSTDVTHGFGLEEYDIDQVLEPGEEETIRFTAEEPGTYTFRCTVFCGAGHGGMQGELIVLPEE